MKIQTSSNNTFQYAELTATVASEVPYPSQGEQCCNDEHEHAPIYCMWHGQTYNEHEVGSLCLDCHKQWFFSLDWSTPECRAERKLELRSWRYWLGAQIGRILSGWKWRNVWDYRS